MCGCVGTHTHTPAHTSTHTHNISQTNAGNNTNHIKNTLKLQLPDNNLRIFFTTRLSSGTNTFIVCSTAFPSRSVFCHMSHPRTPPRTETRCRFQSKPAEVSWGCFFAFLSPKLLRVGDLVPGHAICIIWYTNSTQRFFFFSLLVRTILQWLINNSEAASQSLTYGVFLLGSLRNMR